MTQIGTVPWNLNDELFREQIAIGRKWEAYIAHQLILSGLEVFVPRLAIRSHVSERKKYRDVRDMVVEGRDVEIKSRKEDFSRPSDFPYDSMFVDTREKIESKGPPFAFLVVSQMSGCILAIPGKTRSKWVIRAGFDRTRKINEEWLACPIKLVRSFDEFIVFLKNSPDPVVD
jgi:hypothetical protein